MQEIKKLTIGSHHGIECDEVTDSSNWDQLGLVLRYVKGNKPEEQLSRVIAQLMKHCATMLYKR